MHTKFSEVHEGGQISSGLVINLVVILAVFAFGVLIFSQIQDTAASQADDDCDTIDTLGENLVASVGKTGEEVFPLIELVITLAVFGAIIFILKTWG